jgi:hypothetical protein
MGQACTRRSRRSSPKSAGGYRHDPLHRDRHEQGAEHLGDGRVLEQRLNGKAAQAAARQIRSVSSHFAAAKYKVAPDAIVFAGGK